MVSQVRGGAPNTIPRPAGDLCGRAVVQHFADRAERDPGTSSDFTDGNRHFYQLLRFFGKRFPKAFSVTLTSYLIAVKSLKKKPVSAVVIACIDAALPLRL
jgi:hypothetical protein